MKLLTGLFKLMFYLFIFGFLAVFFFIKMMLGVYKDMEKRQRRGGF